jgi:hypothetical protein
MRRTIVASVIAVIAVAWVASAASTRPRVHVAVRPEFGSPTTRFVVRFRAAQRTGRSGSSVTRYSVVAKESCGRTVVSRVPPTQKGERVRLSLHPKSWCVGLVRGQVQLINGFYCPSICAGPAIRFRIVARFSFRVVAQVSDLTPPSFAGLQHAVQCFPGPQTPGEQRPVSLSWNAATDNVSPSSEIAYEIYMASSAGGEDFSAPNWTTRGATSFTTPNVPAGRFFVVRARDQAGNLDHNRAERQAENPCL